LVDRRHAAVEINHAALAGGIGQNQRDGLGIRLRRRSRRNIPIAGVQGVALLVSHEQQLILAGLANTRPDRGFYKDWEIELL